VEDASQINSPAELLLRRRALLDGVENGFGSTIRFISSISGSVTRNIEPARFRW